MADTAAARALLAQSMGALVALPIVGLWPMAPDQPLALAVGQGIAAALIARLLRSEPWWLPIHLAFVPALVVAGRLELAPGWYLAGFALLALVYWSTFHGRVPLYLSSRATAETLLTLLPERDGLHVIDLGAGTGILLRRLALARPDARFTGIEHAPLPFLLALFNTRGLANCRVTRGNFWHHDLSGYDAAYAFLSPVPMPRLWDKARREMRRGTWLISNTFPVPDVEADRIVTAADRRRSRLHCYVI